MMVAAFAKIIEDACIAIFFVYVYRTILKLKRKYLKEDFTPNKKGLAVVVLILSLNVFE